MHEYRDLAEENGYEDDPITGLSAADVAVMREEGTYNPLNGHFWCTGCYIINGMPLGHAP